MQCSFVIGYMTVYSLWSLFVQVVVLPPGEWDPTVRIPPPASPRKMNERLTTNAQVPMPHKEKVRKGEHGGGGGDGEEESLHHAGLKRSGK